MEKKLRSIMLVDDEDTLRSMVQNLLCSNGYFVNTASSGKKAIELVADPSNKIDLVLLDLSMPIMNGEETLREIRKIRPDLKVVLCTGYSEDEVVERFAELKLSGILQKPYSLKKLLQQIKDVLV
ncbi:MAG: response regulator [Bdellovibrionia bacterium]